MPSIKISEFSAFANLDSPELNDILPILDITEIDSDLKNKKATIGDILNLITFPPGEVNTASNIGIGQGIFDSKVGPDLQFKTLIAGNNIGITSNLSTITIDNIAPLGEINTASNLGLGEGLYKSKALLNLNFKSLIAGSNIALVSTDNDITINSTVLPGEINTASNLGTGSFIFNNKVGVNLQFKSLVAGAGISLVNNANDITLINTSLKDPYIISSFTGTLPIASGSQSIAMGIGTTATSNDTIAIGNTARSSAFSAISLGVDARADNVNSIQLGTGLNNIPNSLQYLTKTIANEQGIEAPTYSTAGLPITSPPSGSLTVSTNTNQLLFRSNSTWYSTGDLNSAINLGTGQGVYETKVNQQLRFKTLTAGSGITLTSTPTEINIVNNTSTVSFNVPISTNTVLNNNFHNKFVQVDTQSNNVTITLSNSVQDGFTCFLFHNKGTGSNQIIINNNTLTFLSRGATIQNPAATASLIYNATTSTWYGVGDLI